jgi:BON domain
MKLKPYIQLSGFALVAILGLAIGCSKAANDAQITSDIQTKLSADSGLAGKQIAVQADKGSVTLSGVVDNDAQREAAARYAAAEPGVRQVVNNLTVGAQQAEATPPPAAQAQPAASEQKPHAGKRRHHDDSYTSQDDNSAPPPPSESPAVAETPAPAAPAPVAPPPPPPPPQKVSIPSGTVLAVRLVDSIDSETAQPGQTFHATLDSPIAVDGEVAIPQGYDVEGHIVDVKSAGKFAGQSLLKLQLDRISVGGKYYNIETDEFSRQGTSRGKNTAEKVGAGAGIGAIIGAIAGGGKGAAIGAAAGGGLGGGVQAATKGQQIKLPSETVLNFTLQSSVSVTPTTHGPHENRQRLDANQ